MPEPSDIDLLMARIDEINHKTPPLPAEDIDTIIANCRLARARKAAGEKPSRAKTDLSKIMGALTSKPASTTAIPKFTLKF